MKWISSITAISFLLFPFSAFAVPSLADTPPLGGNDTNHALDTTVAYTVPSGTNQVFFVRGTYGGVALSSISATQNGVNVPFTKFNCSALATSFDFYGILAGPVTGNFVMHDTELSRVAFVIGTLNNADQTNPVNSTSCNGYPSGSTAAYSTTTPPAANTFLMDMMVGGSGTGSSHGAGQTEYVNYNHSAIFASMYASYVNGSSTPSTSQGMSEIWSVGSAIQSTIISFVSPAANSFCLWCGDTF